jgi:hypothetical protein
MDDCANIAPIPNIPAKTRLKRTLFRMLLNPIS